MTVVLEMIQTPEKSEPSSLRIHQLSWGQLLWLNKDRPTLYILQHTALQFWSEHLKVQTIWKTHSPWCGEIQMFLWQWCLLRYDDHVLYPGIILDIDEPSVSQVYASYWTKKIFFWLLVGIFTGTNIMEVNPEKKNFFRHSWIYLLYHLVKGFLVCLFIYLFA